MHIKINNFINKLILKSNSFFIFIFYLLFFINYILDFSNIEIFIMFLFFIIFFYTRKSIFYLIATFMYLIIYKSEIEGGYGSFFYINFIFYSLLIFVIIYKLATLFSKNYLKINLVYAAFLLNLGYLLFPKYYFYLFFLKLFF